MALKFNVVKPLQPENAEFLMEVTPVGMVIEVFAPGHCIKVS